MGSDRRRTPCAAAPIAARLFTGRHRVVRRCRTRGRCRCFGPAFAAGCSRSRTAWRRPRPSDHDLATADTAGFSNSGAAASSARRRSPCRCRRYRRGICGGSGPRRTARGGPDQRLLDAAALSSARVAGCVNVRPTGGYRREVAADAGRPGAAEITTLFGIGHLHPGRPPALRWPRPSPPPSRKDRPRTPSRRGCRPPLRDEPPACRPLSSLAVGIAVIITWIDST